MRHLIVAVALLALMAGRLLPAQVAEPAAVRTAIRAARLIDGKELFYIAPDGRLMAVPIAAGADRQTLEPGAPLALFPTRLATGANISVGGLSKPQYAVAPDGRFLMNVAVDEGTTAPITVVLNWDAGLRK